ncbi:MAG: tetratricopeptide repeat protein [Chloroflexota bacterium]
MRMKTEAFKWFFVSAMLFLNCLNLFAGNFEKGNELFLYNKPSEAALFMERAIIEDPSNAAAYYRLGIIYEQLKQYDKATAALRSALDRNYGKKAELYGHMAKIQALKGNLDECIRYNTLAIQENPEYSPVILNRANAWFRKDNLDSAMADYQNFISVDPENALKPEVVRMIQSIQGLKDERELSKKQEAELQAAELAKKQEEEKQQQLVAEKKRQEEEKQAQLEAAKKQEAENQKRLADDKRRQEEAAKKKQLDDLFNSLNAATNEQTNLSAGTEDVQNRQSDLKLEE